MQCSGRGENRKEMKREMVRARGRDTFSLQEMNHFHLRMRGHRLLPFSPPGELDSAASTLVTASRARTRDVAAEERCD